MSNMNIDEILKEAEGASEEAAKKRAILEEQRIYRVVKRVNSAPNVLVLKKTMYHMERPVQMSKRISLLIAAMTDDRGVRMYNVIPEESYTEAVEVSENVYSRDDVLSNVGMPAANIEKPAKPSEDEVKEYLAALDGKDKEIASLREEFSTSMDTINENILEMKEEMKEKDALIKKLSEKNKTLADKIKKSNKTKKTGS